MKIVKTVSVIVFVIVLATLLTIGQLGCPVKAGEGIKLEPFEDYLEFAEWVSNYQVPELEGEDCGSYEGYAYRMFIDGLNKGHWVSNQVELTKESGHMYVSAYVYIGGDIKIRFVDAETRRIYKYMYGTMWRVNK